MDKRFLTLAAAVMFFAAACGSGKTAKQDAEMQYDYWVCPQGDHKGAVIFLARIGNVFRGEYIDPDYDPVSYSDDDPNYDPNYQEYISIPIMGTIDGEGNVTGVSAASRSDGSLIGELSGKISGGKFHAIWLPAPSGFGEYREMDLQLEKLSPEMEEQTGKHPNTFYNALHHDYAFVSLFSGEDRSRAIPFFAETAFPAKSYGYNIGEFVSRQIHIAAGAKQGEVDFHLRIEESGQQWVKIDVRGIARLNGNRFRYEEKTYEFEVEIYHDFAVIKTISGFLQYDNGLSTGFTADGVYPAKMELSTYVKYEI